MVFSGVANFLHVELVYFLFRVNFLARICVSSSRVLEYLNYHKKLSPIMS